MSELTFHSVLGISWTISQWAAGTAMSAVSTGRPPSLYLDDLPVGGRPCLPGDH